MDVESSAGDPQVEDRCEASTTPTPGTNGNTCGASGKPPGPTTSKGKGLRYGVWDHNEKDRSKKKQKTIQSAFGSKEASVVKLDATTARKELARMIVCTALPFKFVDSLAFRQCMKYLNPNLDTPSRVTIAEDIYSMYLEEKAHLKQFFAKGSQRVRLSTDIWTSCQKSSYLCLTAHYIDDEWKLQKKLLNFCQTSNCSSEMIGRVIEQCLITWGIRKVFTITADSASSTDQAIHYLKERFCSWNTLLLKGDFLHVRCGAHLLNLTVKEAFKDISDAIFRICSAVKYAKSSRARMQRFDACVEQKKLEIKGSVWSDRETRWDSTYLMLESALKFRKAFESLEYKE